MVKKGQPKKKKLKLKVKVLVKILVFLCVVSLLIYYYLNLNIKNIYITGNKNVLDVEIIEVANIKDYPLVKDIKLKNIEENITNLPLIKSAKVSLNPFGKITIKVEETNILFFYKYNSKYITYSRFSVIH